MNHPIETSRTLPWVLSSMLVLAVVVSSAGCGDDSDAAKDDAGRPDFFACEANSDCIVVPESCCGTCGAPTRGDAVAINAASVADRWERECSGSMGCPTCAPLFIDPTLVATCRDQRCTLIDLRRDEISTCTQDLDCRLRTPDCCECGGDTSLGRLLGIAISAEPDYASLVCDPGQACDDCLPVYPDEVTVACSANGRCESSDSRVP